MPDGPALTVRVLTAAAAPAYREVRLAGLRNDPLAFITTAGEYEARPLPEIAARLDPTSGVVNLGAFQDGSLVGILTVLRPTRPTLAHRAEIVGVSVLPEARGQGAGAALVRAGIEQARAWEGVTSLHLAVTETQGAARRLYGRHGFRVWGTEPDAVRQEGRVYAQHHLWLSLKGDGETLAWAEGGIEALDMLGAANPVQGPEDHPLVGCQAVCMTDGIQVGGEQALPQSERAQRVSLPHEAAHDPPGGPVHRQPQPEGTVVATDKRA